MAARRTRIYGEHRIDLAERAGQRRGWATGTFTLYGKTAVKRYKTFVAAWRPAGGAIRVVLVDEPAGWAAFFCTDPAATRGTGGASSAGPAPRPSWPGRPRLVFDGRRVGGDNAAGHRTPRG